MAQPLTKNDCELILMALDRYRQLIEDGHATKALAQRDALDAIDSAASKVRRLRDEAVSS